MLWRESVVQNYFLTVPNCWHHFLPYAHHIWDMYAFIKLDADTNIELGSGHWLSGQGYWVFAISGKSSVCQQIATVIKYTSTLKIHSKLSAFSKMAVELEERSEYFLNEW